MPIQGHPPDNRPIFTVLCAPCRAGWHQDCRGAVVTCECWAEVLIDAEERP